MAAAFTAEQAGQLLDFSQKLDISLLDAVVNCFYSNVGPQVRVRYACQPSCISNLQAPA